MEENSMKLNYENYERDSENYSKLLKKIIREMPTETLINELKRRKIIKFDWGTGKFKEFKDGL